MDAIPEDDTELLTLRSAVLALEESGRMSAAQVLAMNPRAPPSQPFNGSDLYTWRNLRRWADDLFEGPDPAVDWSSPAWVPPEDVEASATP